jgi:hypothetical protein
MEIAASPNPSEGGASESERIKCIKGFEIGA